MPKYKFNRRTLFSVWERTEGFVEAENLEDAKKKAMNQSHYIDGSQSFIEYESMLPMSANPEDALTEVDYIEKIEEV